MGAAIAHAHDGVLVGHQLLDHVEVAVHIVQKRPVQHGLAVAGGHELVGQLLRRDAGPQCAGRQARLGRRFVFRRVAHLEDLVKAAKAPGGNRIAGRFGEDLRPHVGTPHQRKALGKRQLCDLQVRRVRRERILRQLEPEHQPDGAAADLGLERRAFAHRLAQHVEHLAPAFGMRLALGQRNRQRPARREREAVQQAELRGRVVEVRDHLQHALADLAHGLRDGHQLALGRMQRRRGRAVAGFVLDRARGRKADGAGVHRLGCQPPHLVAVSLGGRLAPRSALAHHVHAQRGMRQLRGDVDVKGLGLQRVQVFGEAFPAPGEALGQHGARQVFDAFHEFDQHVALLRPARREANTTVAHDAGGDAVPGRRRELFAPHRLRVVVGVDIDETGRDDLAGGVDFQRAGAQVGTHRRDRMTIDSDVANEGRTARAIDDGAAPDHYVEHVVRPKAGSMASTHRV